MKPFENMSTEDLQKLLREDFEGKNSDPQRVQSILEILRSREAFSDAELQEAWEEQQSYFNTPEGRNASLFSEEAAPTGKKTTLLRGLAVAAMLAVVLLAAIFPAGGAGSMGSLLGRWTKNVFWFDGKVSLPEDPDLQSPGYHGENPDLQRLYDAVSQYDVGPVVPCWIPEGYTIEDWDDFGVFHISGEDGEKSEIGVEFSRGEDRLKIRIFVSNKVPNVVYEKDEAEVTVYCKNGTEYHIMSNNGQYSCVWQNGSYGGAIIGDITTDELYRMIDSIYKGE